MKSGFFPFSEKIFGSRKILPFLIAANLAGFFAGLYFYWDQLMDSQPLFWLAIIDSPLSVLLFASVCLLFYFRKRVPEWLKLLASAYVVKYGIWTMLTLWLYRANYVVFEDQVIGVLDFALHLGMVVEGGLLIPQIRPKIRDAAIVLFLCLANDFFDYFLGTVTKVPPEHVGFLMTESFTASILIVAFVLAFSFSRKNQAGRKPGAKPYQRTPP